MDYSLTLALTLLQLVDVGSAAPVPGEVTRMKSKVKWMAEQLVVKLNKDFQVSKVRYICFCAVNLDDDCVVFIHSSVDHALVFTLYCFMSTIYNLLFVSHFILTVFKDICIHVSFCLM